MNRRRNVWSRVVKYWAPLMAGGLAWQLNLGGCDPEVRNAVLTGLQDSLVGLFDTVISAFFLSLQDAGGGTTTQPVVQATLDVLKIWLA